MGGPVSPKTRLAHIHQSGRKKTAPIDPATLAKAKILLRKHVAGELKSAAFRKALKK